MNQLNQYGTTYAKYSNFLPEEIMQKLSDYTNNILSQVSRPMFTTNYSWQHALNFNEQVRSPVLTHNIMWTPAGRKLANIIGKYADKKLPKPFKCQIGSGPMIHLWPPKSNINWHSDFVPDPDDPTNVWAPNARIGALTVYYNKEWKDEWGGKLVLASNKDKSKGQPLSWEKEDQVEIIDRITPSYNSAVFLQAPFDHSTTPVEGKVMRKSLQIWLKPRL